MRGVKLIPNQSMRSQIKNIRNQFIRTHPRGMIINHRCDHHFVCQCFCGQSCNLFFHLERSAGGSDPPCVASNLFLDRRIMVSQGILRAGQRCRMTGSQPEQVRECFAKLGHQSNRKRPVRDQEPIVAATSLNLPRSLEASNGKRCTAWPKHRRNKGSAPLLSCHPKVLELILVQRASL